MTSTYMASGLNPGEYPDDWANALASGTFGGVFYMQSWGTNIVPTAPSSFVTDPPCYGLFSETVSGQHNTYYGGWGTHGNIFPCP
jgi:hypothetical protein